MAEWTMKKLKDIVNFNPRESLAKGVVAKKFAMDKLQPFCRDILGYELEPFFGGTKFRNGDTIMARITPCLENGKAAKVAVLDDGEVGFGSTEYIVFRAKDGVDEDFIYYLVCSPIVREPAIKSMVGSSGRQRVQTDVVQNLEIMVPDYEEQKRISGLLKSLDDKITTNTEINKNLLDQAQSIFTQEFLTLDSIPDNWQESSLLGIADYLNGLAMQKYRPKDDEQGLPVLKIKELRQGFCNSNSELCSPSINPEYIVHDGDVIFSWSGSLLVDIWCGGTCGLNQHLFKVTSSIYDKWFYYAWTNHHLQKFAAIAADMATTMGHIKREDLSKAEVLIPSQSDYDRIGGLLTPLYGLVIANRMENRKLSYLRDALLPQLMSGLLDVSGIDL
ncbi:MAG: restriction endonuclease subunit S [Negativicoccus succinicivorans]|uniref:restriction endonuclease subunit S n=1 Tax=Negativicoccus succinicivorans TaxID=620903 RepID=UPI0029123856|nr:restriction endonuclease subunit S [Negativicoccus succinicivorans]MDU4558770.1 restriction endonuclease subunit S [Negativicoccus succinicivorans]MDU4575771.1 restriction endonuclease subunit S [Negativicoccus succinicivorans]